MHGYMHVNCRNGRYYIHVNCSNITPKISVYTVQILVTGILSMYNVGGPKPFMLICYTGGIDLHLKSLIYFLCLELRIIFFCLVGCLITMKIFSLLSSRISL